MLSQTLGGKAVGANSNPSDTAGGEGGTTTRLHPVELPDRPSKLTTAEDAGQGETVTMKNKIAPRQMYNSHGEPASGKETKSCGEGISHDNFFLLVSNTIKNPLSVKVLLSSSANLELRRDPYPSATWQRGWERLQLAIHTRQNILLPDQSTDLECHRCHRPISLFRYQRSVSQRSCRQNPTRYWVRSHPNLHTSLVPACCHSKISGQSLDLRPSFH